MNRPARRFHGPARNRNGPPIRRPALAAATGEEQDGTMPRPDDDKVIPFRPRPRRWTRPEDYRRPGRAPKPPRPPKPGWTRLAAWAAIAAVVALTAAYSLWR